MFDSLLSMFGRKKPSAIEEHVPDVSNVGNEQGSRSTPENSVKYLYRNFYVDLELRASILDVRDMDRKDGRVKRLHNRTARDATKGGLILECKDERVRGEWKKFAQRVGLNNPAKLRSDARGMFMEGNLCMQWVLSADRKFVAAGVRMPSDTITPQVNKNGVFVDKAKAYRQHDIMTGSVAAEFALYQLTVGRMDPDNYDDHGSMGRPYLDAQRVVWRKLTMTEEDLVIRRRTRAPQRTAHILKGMDADAVGAYIERNEQDMHSITTDFYVAGDGDVRAVTGDAALDQIADVSYLLDTFYAGAPAPKGLFGYNEGLSRDILEDLKKDYFEEVDAMQDAQAFVYLKGFELHLLLQGINPLDACIKLGFAERRTETPNQTTDRALKWQALGMPSDEIYRMLGRDPERVREQKEDEAKRRDPYPEPSDIRPVAGQRVKITPGNASKGESATSITNG